MYILINDLCNELNKYSKVLIYGAGHYANIIYRTLKKEGLRNKINSFLVTNPGKIKDIDGIEVKAADSLKLYDKKETVILIAVNRENEREIVKMVKQDYGFFQEIKLLDYILQDDELYWKLGEASDEWFARNVIDFYIWDHTDSTVELEKKRKEMKKYIRCRKVEEKDKNTIVFISGDLKPRSEKIIAALAKKKYRVVVFEYGFCNELVRKEIISSNVEFYFCKDMLEVLYKALQHNPLVYYFEPFWGDCSVSEIMIRHKDLFGKIVFAPYDILNAGYVQVSESEKFSERYCLENADGIVWRWFSKRFLEDKKGFVYKGKSFQFLDYCKGFDVKNKDKDNSDNKLKICFVQGGIYELLNKTIFSNDGVYAEPARIDTILKEIGNVSDCVFHIFIGRCNDDARKELDILKEEYSNFKVFYGMEYDKLITKISEYDYGCFFMTAGKEIPEQQSVDNVYYGNIYIDGVTNRFFDYLDAGIPIISTAQKKQCEYFDRYGVVVKMNIANLNIKYLKKNKAFYRKNVERARSELLIENHIQRMTDWFHTL